MTSDPPPICWACGRPLGVTQSLIDTGRGWVHKHCRATAALVLGRPVSDPPCTCPPCDCWGPMLDGDGQHMLRCNVFKTEPDAACPHHKEAAR